MSRVERKLSGSLLHCMKLRPPGSAVGNVQGALVAKRCVLFTMLGVAAWLALAHPPAARGAALPGSASSSQQPMRTPRFRRYSVQDGMPSNSVYTTQQDRDGFIWIGTRNGLARFDGTHFEVFQHRPGKPYSLGANDTSEVLVDRQGRIWAGGEASGLNLYLPDRHGFKHWRQHKGDPHSLSADDVFALAQTADGAIWVGTYAGDLNRMTADGKGFTHVSVSPGDAGAPSAHPMRHTVTALAAGPHGGLWIGTPAGLMLRHRDGRMQRVRFVNVKSSAVYVSAIHELGSHVYVTTIFGIFQVDSQLQAHRFIPLHQTMLDSAVDSRGNMWVASIQGLFIRSRDGRIQHVVAHKHWRGRLPVPGINHVMFDRHGGLWVATRGGGLLYRAAAWRHTTYFPLDGMGDSTSAMEHVDAVSMDGEGHLLVGGPDFLAQLNPATGHLTHLLRAFWKMRGVGAIIPLSAARTLIAGGDRLCMLHASRCLRSTKATGAIGGIFDAVVGPSGRIYIANYNGDMYELSISQNAPQWRELRVPAPTVDDEQVTQLRMHEGRLWRGSHAGLSVLDESRGVFQRVPGLPRTWVRAFNFHGKRLWMATRSELLEYRREHGTWRRVLSAVMPNGRSMPQTMDIHIDHEGRLWLLCVGGLWSFDPSTRAWHDFHQDAADPNMDFIGHHAVTMADGTVYMGTARGLFGFRPDAMHVRPQPPQLVVDAVNVQRRDRKVSLPGGRGPVNLHWNDRDLSVAISAPTFVDPQHTQYRFRLRGFDPGWIGTGHRHIREFSGLGAGRYTLDVEASGPNGAWGHLSTPLHIRVQAPPWETPWAWATYVLLAAMCVWVAFRFWRRRLEQRHRMQLAHEQRRLAEQASDAKTRFLANLSHEIRTPMTGVLGMAELLLAEPLGSPQRGYVQAIERSGTILLKLVNDALDLARIETRGLDLDVAPFSPRILLEDIDQLESGLAARKGLQLRVQVDDDVPQFVCGDVVRVKQVVLNLVGNALKFTEKGCVSIRIMHQDGGLNICIADTGAGIPEASRERLFQRFEQDEGPERDSGSGLGLAICRELVAAMQGRIELHSQPGQGSRFDVWLPLRATAAGHAEETMHEMDGAAWTVLLVEDDSTVADVIRGMLQRHGHTVVHQSNGLNALAELESVAVDALVLDLNLPGLDGLGLMRMLRGREAYASLPIVAITARSGGHEQQQAEQAGADGFLRKPLSGRDLQAELVRVVNLRAAAAGTNASRDVSLS